MVRIGEISAYWQKPTVAPVVQVDSPEAAERIRRLYPYDHPRFVTDWQTNMGAVEIPVPKEVGEGIF